MCHNLAKRLPRKVKKMEPLGGSVVGGLCTYCTVCHFGDLIWLPELYEVSLLLQTEIAKRLNTILAQIMPFLSQEVRLPLAVSSFNFQGSPLAGCVSPEPRPCSQIPTEVEDELHNLGVYRAFSSRFRGRESYGRDDLLILMVELVLCHCLSPERRVLACSWGSNGQWVPLCPRWAIQTDLCFLVPLIPHWELSRSQETWPVSAKSQTL